MSNKYEREIEEILRNLERTEPKGGLRRKVGGSQNRKVRASRSMPAMHFTFSEWSLITACVLALAAGGWAFAHQGDGDIVTGMLAVVGFICLVIVAFSNFMGRSPFSSSQGRYTNITSLRRNPLSILGTRWHLLMLKLRYRKRKDQER